MIPGTRTSHLRHPGAGRTQLARRAYGDGYFVYLAGQLLAPYDSREAGSSLGLAAALVKKGSPGAPIGLGDRAQHVEVGCCEHDGFGDVVGRSCAPGGWA